MKAKSLLPFIVVLAILVVLVVVRQGNQETPSIVDQAKFAPLVPEGLDAGDIDRVELYAGAKAEEKVILARVDGDTWQVASHFGAPAKADAIDTFLENVVDMSGERRATADSEEKLSDYSLKDDEAFHVQAFKSAEGGEAVVDLLFGKSPKHGAVFLREAGGDTVYVEAKNLRQEAGVYGDELDKAPEASKWLDKDIVKVDKEKITRVALTTPDKALVFERREKEVPPEPAEEPAEEDAEDTPLDPPKAPEFEWVLASGGFTQEFKTPGLDKVKQKLSALSASDIVDPAKKAEYGLEPPAFVAAIAIEGEDDLVIEGGRPDLAGDGYLRVASGEADVVYKVSTYNFDQLFIKGSELFDLPSLDLGGDTINRVEIDQPEGNLVLVKEESAWKVAQPAVDLDVQSATLSTLASTLASLKATDYADKDLDAVAPVRVIRFAAEGKAHTLTLGADAAGVDGVLAKLDDGSDTLIVSRTDVKKLLLPPRDVYVLDAVDIDEASVTAIDVVQGGSAFKLTRDGEAWRLHFADEEHDADAEACGDLLASITEIQADGFRLDVAPDAVAAETTITLTRDGADPYALDFGAAQDGKHLMRLSEKGTVFDVEAETVGDLAEAIEAAKQPKAVEPPAEEAPVETPVEAAVEPVPEEAPVETAVTPAPVDAPIETVVMPAPVEMAVEAPAEVLPAPAPVEAPAEEIPEEAPAEEEKPEDDAAV